MLGKDGLNLSTRCLNPKCPSLSSKNKLKLVIKLDDEKYHCWVCDLKGIGVAKLYSRFVPRYLDESKKYFNKKIKIQKIEHSVEAVTLPKNFILLATAINDLDPDVRAVVRYLYSRGLTDHDLWKFKFGTCRSGANRRRVIFPSFDSEGMLNYWSSRSIDPDVMIKYKNVKAKKNEIIFNDLSIDWAKPLTLVEGPFDLVKCDTNSTCLLGSVLNEKFSLFHKIIINKTPIILALDSDATFKSHKIAEKLYEFGIDVSIMPLGNFHDVGEMNKNDFQKQYSQRKRWSPSLVLSDKIDKIFSGSIF
jgi:DNA primase